MILFYIMSNGTFLVVLVWALVCSAEEITTLGDEVSKPRPDAGPSCMDIIDGVEKKYNCSGVVVTTVDKDTNVKINCDGQPLKCSGLPSLNFGMHMPIQLLLIERCAVPDNLMCVLEKLNATGLSTLYYRSVSTPLTVDTVRGLHMMQTLFIYRGTSSSLGAPGPQTNIPVEVMKQLPYLVESRMQEDAITSLVPLAFNQSGQLPLRFLELSLNNITELLADTFYGLGKLEKLNLFKNNIMTIDVNAFRGLDSLQALYLDDNSITGLPAEVFTSTPLLRELSLSRNRQPLRLHAGVLSGLHNLNMLDFNECEGLHLDPQSLSNLSSLQDLQMQGCSITELPEDLFLGTTAIVNLTLKSNQLKSLPDAVFSGLARLQRLDLSDNLLESVSRATFMLLHDLKQIQLDGNRLTFLPGGLFSSLGVLFDVSISNNKLSDVRSAFHGAQARTLSLAHNRLAWACYSPEPRALSLPAPSATNTTKIVVPELQSPLLFMDGLQHLDLSHNSITEICADWLHTMLNLRTLNLSYNNLTKIKATDANFISDNITVDLRNNRITSVEPPVYMTQYPTLLLAGNPYNCDCKLYDVLKQLKNLPYRVEEATCAAPPPLHGVNLTSIVHGQRTGHISLLNLTCPLIDPPEHCKCLERPELSRTECSCPNISNTTLPDPRRYGSMALTLRSVEHLDEIPSFVNELNLSNLELAMIPDIPKHVTHLDLRNNRLSEIPLEILQRNITLQLGGNKLKCGCWHSDNVKNIFKYKQKIKDNSDLICTDEVELMSIDLTRQCSTENAIAYGTCLVVMAIVIAFGIVSSYKYSLEMKVYLFNRGWTFLVKEEAIDKNKKYDVFISFVHEDEELVLEHILSELDKSYKVCVHTRDWIVGDNIVEQIYRSVAESRRTLIVLSENFLVSNSWSMEEFRAVQAQTAADKIPRAIIILVGDVDRDAAPDIIQRHLDVNTYIKWGDSMFWDRLRYALPKNKLKAEDVRRRKFTAKAVENLAKGALNVAVNEDGQLVNTNLKRNGRDIMTIQNGLTLNANLENNDYINMQNLEVIVNNLKNEHFNNMNNQIVHNNKNGNLKNECFNNMNNNIVHSSKLNGNLKNEHFNNMNNQIVVGNSEE